MLSGSAPYADFAEASRAVLRYLKQTIPFGAWIVSRIEGRDYVVLAVEADAGGIKAGDTLPAEDTMCLRMLAGEGPHIAPDVQRVPAYQALLGRYPQAIGAYIGFPLQREDGSDFGTLCAVDAQRREADIEAHRGLLELMARLLATILHFDLQREDLWRRALHGQAQSMTDALTGALNRRGWDLVCAREDDHCRHYGDPLCVLQIDLDGLKRINDEQGHAAGDHHIALAARTVKAQLPTAAALARTGGDEFSVLLPKLRAAEAQSWLPQLREALDVAGVAASIGLAQRKPWRDIAEAWQRADQAMYAEKRARKADQPRRN